MRGEDFRDRSDESLAAEFQAAGKQECFAELFRRHAEAIGKGCRASLGSVRAAEDITQEAFLNACRSIARFHGGSFGAWLHTIARNLCINYLKARENATDPLPETEEELPVPRRNNENDVAVIDQVKAVLNLLPDDQRLVLKLSYIEGFTYKETAERLGFSQKKVKACLQSGRRNFQAHWERLEARGKTKRSHANN